MAKNTAPNPPKNLKTQNDGFEDVKLDTFQYKIGEKASRDTFLQGYLVDYVRMPDSDRADNPEWWCFVVQLTAPCTAFDRDGEAKECGPGDTVLFNVPAKLKNYFGRLAINPQMVTEIKLGSWKQIDIGGGKKMWSPEVCKTNSKTVKARLGFCQPPVGPLVNPNLNGRTNAPQLGAGDNDAAEDLFG
jgi:hypothetical protein